MRIHLNLPPLDAPEGTPLDAVERFHKLTPIIQRYAVAARERQGLEPPGTLAKLEAAARGERIMIAAGDDG